MHAFKGAYVVSQPDGLQDASRANAFRPKPGPRFLDEIDVNTAVVKEDLFTSTVQYL